MVSVPSHPSLCLGFAMGESFPSWLVSWKVFKQQEHNC